MSTLQVKRREPTDKVQVLRRAGFLPMALLRQDHTTELIQANEESLRKALAAADGLGRVDIETDDGQKLKAVVRDVEKNALTHRLVHAVLQVVSEDDTVKMDIAVLGVGIPGPVSDGVGTLLQATDHLKLKGKMSSIPDHLEVDISKLELGGHISASEVTLPAGVDLLTSPDAVVFSVNPLRAQLEEAAATETPAEPASTE
jgi:large subunit ribosomal protein L25